jgi:hypothetical protein
MNAKELADKFNAKTDTAVVERKRQSDLAAEYVQERVTTLSTVRTQWRATFCRS